MKKKLEILIGVCAIAAIVLILLSINGVEETGQVVGTGSGGGSSVPGTSAPAVNYGNMVSYLSVNPMIQDLPEGAVISLRFYNFDKGYREWERSYTLTTGSAVEGLAESQDLTVFIASKYIPYLSTHGLCNVVNQAKANGDLGTETGLSTLKLMWKFKSMFSYRECLGF